MHYGKKAGSDLHVRRVLIDMAESPSTRRAVPADRQETDSGNKKTRSPVCLKIILLQRGELFYSSFTVRICPQRMGMETEGIDVEKVLEVRVCV